MIKILKLTLKTASVNTIEPEIQKSAIAPVLFNEIF